MRVSLNTIKQYTAVDLPVDELVTKINSQLGGVEQVVDIGKRYEGATIALVTKCEKHSGADKLSVCEIDAGQGKPIQVVCGAPNVSEGMLVVWLPPGTIVPATADDKEPFVLAEKELRGVMSHGMLASPK
jgi:phenylalanyl-tRNA synthetase beta chain